MSVYRLRYGTPEKTVPSAFAPKPLCAVSEEPPEEARRISFTLSHRGVLLTLPIDPLTGIYGFGLQMKGFQCTGKQKIRRGCKMCNDHSKRSPHDGIQSERNVEESEWYYQSYT